MPEPNETAAYSSQQLCSAAPGALPASARGSAHSGPPVTYLGRNRGQAPSARPPRARPAPVAPPTIFDRLDADFRRSAFTPLAKAEVARWAQFEPALVAKSPAAIVASVTWLGYRATPHGALVLSALLRQAQAPLAARTLLQALLPRIRAERVVTPTYGHGLGETWSRPADTVADLVAECFAAIKRHAGEDRLSVDKLIVGEGARRLRTARQAQRRYQSRTAALLEERASSARGDLTSARSDAEWLAGAVVEAVRVGRLGCEEARLVYATRVQGWPASEAARRQGIAPAAVYYALQAAERALLASVNRLPAA